MSKVNNHHLNHLTYEKHIEVSVPFHPHPFYRLQHPQMAIDQQLHTSTAMPVKGRQGWMGNQHLPFGEFTSGKVNRGWLKRYDIPFIVRFSGAKEKLAYDLTEAAGPD